MEIPSGVHGNFKVTKPSRFGRSRNPEAMVNNGNNQFSSIPNSVPDGKKQNVIRNFIF